MRDAQALLRIRALDAGYGESHVLHGIDLDVRAGEVSALVGRNGSGRSTMLRAITGLVWRRGSIRLDGREMIAARPDQIGRAGIGYCPEERGIFASLTARENLMLPPRIGPGGLGLEEVFDLFPNLQGRLDTGGTRLSGGEQQMLALARILRSGAKLLLLDEPTEGLAPVIVQQITSAIGRLKRQGFTVLLVEQNIRVVEALADNFTVIENGRVIDRMSAVEAGRGDKPLHRHLGI